jgi:DNA-binding FrmR family transcriptional regulator
LVPEPGPEGPAHPTWEGTDWRPARIDIRVLPGPVQAGARQAHERGPMAGNLESEGRTMLAHSRAGARERQAARQRLRTAQGHLDAVLRMLDADRYCVDILHQLSAVEAAITRARRDIVEGHLRGCVPGAIRDGSIEIEDVAEEMVAVVFGNGAPAARSETRAVR